MNSSSASHSDAKSSDPSAASAEDLQASSPEITETTVESHNEQAAEPVRIRYRVRFAKSGLLRWISHRDLARLWERMLRRAQFRLSMTQGFNPKPRIGFPSALALGVDGLEEVVELEFAEDLAPAVVLRRLENDQQPGLAIASVCKVPEGFKKPQLERSEYLITKPDDVDDSIVKSAIDKLLSTPTVSVIRKKKTLIFETQTQILSLVSQSNSIELTLAASDAATLKPQDVLELLGFQDWIERGSLITRNRVHLQQDIQSKDPQVIAFAASESKNNQT